MTLRASLLAVAFILALPLFTNALTCPSLYRTLQMGSSGSDVASLQQFLIETGDLAAGNTTGYFGPRTRAAVGSFQCREMQICSGSEATNGWGRVGPMTRARIAEVCKQYGEISTPTPPGFGTGALPQPPQGQSCTLDGQVVLNNQSRTFYSRQSGTQAECTAASQSRLCQNGILFGDTAYRYASCIGTTDAHARTSCTFDPLDIELQAQTILHGQSVTAYQAPSVPAGQTCESQTRTCYNGALSGTYQYATCTMQTPQANTPTITATNTDDPTPGTTVTITGTNFASQNDILLDGVAQQFNVGSTNYGTTIAFVVPANYPTGTINRALTVRNANGTSNARYIRVRPASGGGSGIASFTATPSSGNAPLRVSFAANFTSCTVAYANASIDYGDGSSPSTLLSGSCWELRPAEGPHVYNNPGTYTAKFKAQDGTVLATKQVTVSGAAGTSGDSLTVTPLSGTPPLTVSINGAVTMKAIADTVTAMLDFGDNTPSVQVAFPNCISTTPTVVCPFQNAYSHTYTANGQYHVVLTINSTALGNRNISRWVSVGW